MSEFKFTPGPWEISRIASNEGKGIAIDADYPEYGLIEICEVWGTKNTELINDEAKANANLIAAAPDLLDALIELSRYFVGEYAMDKRSDDEIYSAKEAAENKARAAIAEALGQ